MSASPSLPLLKRIPPGLWVGLVWFVVAVEPIVEYVLMPPSRKYSLSYPRHGLDPLSARLLLAIAFVMIMAGSAQLRRRTSMGYGLLLTGTVFSTVAWRQHEIPPVQYLGVDIALCYIAAARPRRTSLIAAAAALATLPCYLALRLGLGEQDALGSDPYIALIVVIAWLVGNSIRQSRLHTEELHARAAAQAVTAERLRIAREMHDTVAHSIGIIALQAGAAARVIETQPDRAREAMLTVEKTGRETLAGLRRMLGALRQADREADGMAGQDTARTAGRTTARTTARTAEVPQEPAAPASLRPAVGLADVERLAATTTAAGVRVEVRWQGRRRPLPPDLDLAAFRIVQESVTNVVRHSGADSCRVSVDYGEEEIAIEVRDRGKGPAPDAGHDTGYGVVGMRERIALLDGDFTAGPGTDGGFRVAARLPLPADARTR
ncbi:sensor histidine kinase [Streptomyces sparsogenes]|uniref:histidine kinase n=1 Tax=Streptomyces sparsogenes DSM 40356 TaxID=1331668 RepID=A0A1R1SN21_9ACTN|nr:sensor histidine kinase [Streptomyces sparsogenes]OMI39708.1 two-component system sensor kinase [Streptomyces sparsogenes DSM 40356]